VRLAVAGIASGTLFFISFRDFGISYAAWVALVPFLFQLTRSTPRRGLMLGAVTGLVGNAGLVYWTSDVMVTHGGLSRSVSLGVLLALVGYLAFYFTVFGGLSALACRFGGARAILATPVLWVGLEFLRNYPWGGFPWCLIGYSQVSVLPVIQLASVTGIYGVSLLVVYVNSVAAYVLTQPGRRQVLTAVVPAAVLLVGVIGFGLRELSNPLPPASYPVAAVQGNILQGEKWDPGFADRIYADHMKLSRRASSEGARLVVWPESSTPFDFDRTPQPSESMREFARSADVYLLFGSDDIESLDREEGGGYRAYNGAKLITPEGELTLRYRKIVLVPFGEYVPMKKLFFFAEKLTEGVSDFSPGREVMVADVDEGRLGLFICYEAIYSGLVRRFVEEGAELLVNVTNDAWFGLSSGPYQHLHMAIARAVETRRYLIRAANTGVSAIVDPYGRVLEQSELNVEDVVSGKISFRDDETLFVRYGNVMAHACAVATVLFAIVAVVLRFSQVGQAVPGK